MALCHCSIQKLLGGDVTRFHKLAIFLFNTLDTPKYNALIPLHLSFNVLTEPLVEAVCDKMYIVEIIFL